MGGLNSVFDGSLCSRFSEVPSGIVMVRNVAREDKRLRRFLESVNGANQIVIEGVRLDRLAGSAQHLTVFSVQLYGVAAGSPREPLAQGGYHAYLVHHQTCGLLVA